MVAVIGAIGYVDYITGPEFAFSLFYLIPVAYSGWRMGIIGGALIAGLAAIGWFFGEQGLSGYSSGSLFAWRAFTRLGTFLGVGITFALLQKERARVTALMEQFKGIAQRDSLTGLPNRLALVERMKTELEEGRAAGKAVCVILLDFDDFKNVNLAYGFETGDAILREVGKLFDASTRHFDMAARVSGEEFVLVIKNVESDQAKMIAQRLHDQIRNVAKKYPNCKLEATIGIAYFNVFPDSVDALLNKAYAALTDAKKAYRGKAAFWSGRQNTIEPLV